ncbi:MAG: DinB family protein [Chloroflexota bacterium]
MINLEQLGKEFKRNTSIVDLQTKLLTHEDSLLQPESRGNCMNWVLGHMLDSRDRVLNMLGEERLVMLDQKEIYTNGSDPITEDGEHVIKLERLLEMFQIGQERIESGIRQLDVKKLDEMVGKEGREVRFGDRLHFWYFHDTYHTGQLEYLRQLTGVDDQVI